MVEYEGQKREYSNRIEVFHFNDKTGMYKTLSVNLTDTKDSVFFTIRTGIKGGEKNALSLKLSKQEIAYLALDLTKVFNELE